MLYEGVPLAETLTEAWLTALTALRTTANSHVTLVGDMFTSFESSFSDATFPASDKFASALL
jgi:hypothetical protein